MIDINSGAIIPMSLLKLCAKHEVGHAIYYIKNNVPFKYVTIKNNEINWGHVRPIRNEVDYQGFYDVYNFKDEIRPSALKRIRENLRINAEIYLSGVLFQYYQKDDWTWDNFLLYYDELFDLDIDEMIDKYFIVLEERVKHIYPDVLHEYSDFTIESILPEIILVHLITSMFYRNSYLRVYNYIQKTCERVLDFIEHNEPLIEHLTNKLLKHETLTYEQFSSEYKNFLTVL